MNLPALPSQTEWSIIKEQASILVKSQFLPNGIDTPEKAVAIALKGREMGIPMMQAFSHISIINGKPCMSAELMLAQIRKHYPNAPINFDEMSETKCVIQAARKLADKLVKFVFTIEDAVRAGLTGKGPWKQYPKTMLKWRTVSEMARTLFPDALMGVSYTHEEMGAEVNEEGEIIEIASRQVSTPRTTSVTDNKTEIVRLAVRNPETDSAATVSPTSSANLDSNFEDIPPPKEPYSAPAADGLISFGKKFNGKRFSEVGEGPLRSYLQFLKSDPTKPLSRDAKAFIEEATAYLENRKATDEIPF